MRTKIAINGFGRIGRNAFKVAYERPDLEIVAVNDLSDTKTLAHLLRHDSNYGAYSRKVDSDDNNLIVEGQAIKVLAEKDPTKLPWKDLAIDIVIESTGLFVDPTKAKAHITAGAKKVIISAPTKGEGGQTIVIGVNEDKLAQAGDIISNASCTTNCIAPIAAIIEANFGVEKAMMTTVHSYTASQRLLDAPAKDLREARSAATNIVPTTTGASIAAAQALPALEGIFGGLSVRVPTPVVSLCDFAVLTKREVSIDEVNETFQKAAADPYYQGIVAVTEEELVSSDFIGNSHSAIVDLKLTNVVGGNLLKVVAWYDNEWGYCNRLVELTADLGKLLSGGQTAAKAKEVKSSPPKTARIDVKEAPPPSSTNSKKDSSGGDQSLGDLSSQKPPTQPGAKSASKDSKPYTITENPAGSDDSPDKSARSTHAYLEDKSPSKPAESLELPASKDQQSDSKFHHF